MAEKKRTSYIYYTDWAEQLLRLPETLRLRIDDAVKRYVLYGEEPTDKEVLYSMFGLMRTQIDRDSAKYRDKCSKNSNNVRKRWQGKSTNVYDGIRTIQTYTNDTDNDNNNDNIDNKENITKESARISFVIPSVEEVAEYVSENGLDINAASFVDYYTANGWLVGKNKMKDWRAALRNWARRNRLSPDTYPSTLKIADNEKRPIYNAL